MDKYAVDRYTGDVYASSVPSWHDEDAPWKAGEIIKLLAQNRIRPRRIVDVGCGTGGVLRSVVNELGEDAIGEGFDISPYAISMAKDKSAANLTFFCNNFLASKHTCYDLLLCIDVFEHVEDYIGFLRQIRSRSRYFVFHIPLDMNVRFLLRNHHLTERQKVGHLHYFDCHTSIYTLQEAGYDVINKFYTRKPTSSALTKTITIFQNVLAALSSRDFAVKVLGGVSLLVLAQAPEQPESDA